MKKFILLPTFLLFVISSFSQPGESEMRGDYLKKSKKRNKTGMALLLGGTAFLAAAFIIPKGDPTGEISLPYLTEEFENDGIKGSFAVVGTLAMLTSIPFFISSHKNKKRAEKIGVSFRNQKFDYFRQNRFVVGVQPSLSVRLRF